MSMKDKDLPTMAVESLFEKAFDKVSQQQLERVFPILKKPILSKVLEKSDLSADEFKAVLQSVQVQISGLATSDKFDKAGKEVLTMFIKNDSINAQICEKVKAVYMQKLKRQLEKVNRELRKVERLPAGEQAIMLQRVLKMVDGYYRNLMAHGRQVMSEIDGYLLGQGCNLENTPALEVLEQTLYTLKVKYWFMEFDPTSMRLALAVDKSLSKKIGLGLNDDEFESVLALTQKLIEFTQETVCQHYRKRVEVIYNDLIEQKADLNAKRFTPFLLNFRNLKRIDYSPTLLLNKDNKPFVKVESKITQELYYGNIKLGELEGVGSEKAIVLKPKRTNQDGLLADIQDWVKGGKKQNPFMILHKLKYILGVETNWDNLVAIEQKLKSIKSFANSKNPNDYWFKVAVKTASPRDKQLAKQSSYKLYKKQLAKHKDDLEIVAIIPKVR